MDTPLKRKEREGKGERKEREQEGGGEEGIGLDVWEDWSISSNESLLDDRMKQYQQKYLLPVARKANATKRG